MVIINKSGIYSIINTITGKKYIGSSVNLIKRLYNHKYHLNKNSHKNHYLQTSWNKYGESAFNFSIIELVPLERLENRELHWIQISKSSNRQYGYNLEIPNNGHFTHSEETKRLIGKHNKGKIITVKQRNQIRQKLLGKSFLTPEGLQRIKSKLKGRPSPMKGKIPWNKGKPCSEEVKKKIGEANKGRQFSVEHRRLIGEGVRRGCKKRNQFK